MEAWKKNLYFIWLAQILSLMGFGFVLPFVPFYIQELGVTDPDKLKFWTGLLSAAPAVTLGIMAPVWGILSDKIGRRFMMLRALLAGSIIIGVMGFVPSVEWVFVLRLAQGMFTGTITAAATLAAAGTPRNKLSFALGFLSSSTFIGYSLGPLIGGITSELLGYRISFLIGSLIMIIGSIVVFFFVKELQAEDQTDISEKKSKRPAVKDMLKHGILFLLGLLFLLRVSRPILVPFLPIYIQEIRGTIDGSAMMMGIITGMAGLTTAVAGLTITRLGDRMSKMHLLSILMITASILSVPLFFTKSLGSFTVVYMFTMFALGGVEPLLMSITSEKTDASNRGLLFGIQTAFGSAGRIISPLLGSAVAIRFSIRHLFLVFTTLLLLNAVFVLLRRKSGKL